MSDIKYTAEGQRVQVLAELPGGKFLVAGQVGSYEDDHEQWFDTDHPRVVAKVFDQAPVAIHEKRVAELLESVDKLEQRHASLMQQIAAREQSHRQRLAKLAKHDGLQLIEDFIDGKITHYVISEGYDWSNDGHYELRISTPQEEKSGNERNERELKLLALYGKSGRTVEWKLHYYSDGSGGRSCFCWPFTSYDSAREFAVKLFEEACSKSLAKKNRRAGYLLASAKAIGVEPPAWVDASVRDFALAQAKKEQVNAQNTLDLANSKLASLQS